MQLIVLLIVAVVIALLVRTQLNHAPAEPETVLQGTDTEELAAPPVRPEDYETYGRNIENFMQNSADEKLRQIDEGAR